MAKILTGIVTSTKMKKTVVVVVERKLRHRLYKKVITRRKKHKAHYEDMELGVGDKVEIKEIRPVSKEKHFIITKKLKEKS